MDALVIAALVGTGQLTGNIPTTSTPVDALIDQLPTSTTPERALLLTAGTQAIYRLAGTIAPASPIEPVPAGPETLAVCTEEAAKLFYTLLVGKAYKEVLPEALERLQRAGLRLPYKLLSAALTYGTQSDDLRPALYAVLGERGRWLSQFQAKWSWATEFLSTTGNTLPDNADLLWQEGSVKQRVNLLALLRAHDPVRAREWLETVWKKENAEVRGRFLAKLEIGLSLDDEPLLERALDDRSDNVRMLAASLLARIPTSALSRRMLARASAFLNYEDGQLRIQPPTSYGPDWLRDGIIEQPPRAVGERAWWFTQILTRVPPEHWETRFAASPQTLIAAAHALIQDNNSWYTTLLEAWCAAAIFQAAQPWLIPLWNWLIRQSNSNACIELLKLMPQQLAEQKALKLLEGSYPTSTLQQINALPRPWSNTFSNAYLKILRAYFQDYTPERARFYHIEHTLSVAAIALPPDCFDQATVPWILPETPEQNFQLLQMTNLIKQFTDTIQMRKQLLQEIH